MSQLTNARSDLQRSTIVQSEVATLAEAHHAPDKLRDQSEISLWQTLHQGSSQCTLVELRATTTDLARALRHQLTLDPADALVMAVLQETATATRCTRFMSRDAAFRTPMVIAHMQSRQIEFYSEAGRFLSRYFPDALRQ
ncbi:MAG TPA: PIN domain-containing protein [Dehalococcoidia bacterium]|nr:PIN domain-containing protein [Dehalococcoidia bacterium]